MAFGSECVIRTINGRELRSPAAPEPCTYVRVVGSDGNEVAYWNSLEWEEDPVGVMGAIVGALKMQKKTKDDGTKDKEYDADTDCRKVFGCEGGVVWAHNLYDGPCRPQDNATRNDAYSMRRTSCPVCSPRGLLR